jgi:hypothetical protein
MVRTDRMLVAVLVAAVAFSLGAGAGGVAGQPGGPLSNVDVGLATVYQPPYQQLEVFAVGKDGAVQGVWKERNSTWRPPFNLTPPNFAPPGAPLAAVYYPNGQQVEVFVVGNDGTLWVIWKANNGAWQPPGRLTGPNFAPAGAGISAVYYPNGEQLEVFAVDRNGAVSVVWKAKGTDWHPPGAITRPNFAREGAPLAAVYYPNGEQLEVFVVGNGAVQVIWKAKGLNWQPPGTISPPNFAPNNAPLAAVYYPNGEQLEVFVVGNDGVVRGLWKAKGKDWEANVTLTSPGAASPRAPVAAVYQPRNDQLEVFYVGKDGTLWDSWKAKGVNWQPPAKLAGPNFVRDGTPLAAVYQPVNEQLEVYAVDGNGAVQGIWKAQNSPWKAPFSLTGAGITPVVPPGDCVKFLRRWRGGAEDDYLLENCLWIMGIEPYCRAHDAFVAVQYEPNNYHPRYFKCAANWHESTLLEEIDHLVRGIGQGLATAYTAAAPYFGPVVSAYACVQGVIFACATLALDLADRAGLQLPREAADAVQIASHVTKCVDGNIASCAQLGVRGARAAGITIPGEDAIRVAEDVRKCANQDFAACARLGLTAADAAGVPIGLGPASVADIQDCLNDAGQACLALGRDAAQAAGFPLGGVTQGVENARRCVNGPPAGGDTAACLALGKALVGSAVPQGIENTLKCRTGDTTACIALGKALAGSGAAQDAEKALKCEQGDTTACLALGKAVVALAGGGAAATMPLLPAPLPPGAERP